MLTTGFDKLPPGSQLVHTAAFCFTALNVIVLMAPAAPHRLSFGGEDSEAFLRLGSRLLFAAPCFWRWLWQPNFCRIRQGFGEFRMRINRKLPGGW